MGIINRKSGLAQLTNRLPGRSPSKGRSKIARNLSLTVLAAAVLAILGFRRNSDSVDNDKA